MLYETSLEQGFSDFYYSAHYRDHSSDPHIHSHMEFAFVLKGSLILSVNSREYTLSQGELAILLPYQVHSYRSAVSSECFLLACPTEYAPEFRQILRDRHFSPPVVPYAADTAALLPPMIALCGKGSLTESGQESSFKKKALLYCALADLLRAAPLVAQSAPEPDLYRSAIAYISNHYTQKLELSTVARELGVSTAHLSRVLSSRGLGFSSLLNSLRSYEARRLLLQTDLSISQIAFEAGYGSIRNFNRIFQKQFHCLPRELRKSAP